MKPNIFGLFWFVVTFALLMVVSTAYLSVAYAQTTNHCGTLGGNETWSASANVHIVECDVTISAGVTLTIEAGAIIKFQNDADIIVNSRLIAQGTSSTPIYFTSNHDDSIGDDTDGTATAPLVGDWGHIRFNSGSDDSSLITRAVIRYSGSPIDDGAIYLSNASPNLSNITFIDNDINGVEIDNVDWTTRPWSMFLKRGT